jgi:hypothetical protein
MTQLPPTDVGLGEVVDALLTERAELEPWRRAAYEAHEAAAAAVKVAERDDRDAYVAALRAKDGADPKTPRTDKAAAAADAAERKLLAVRDAEHANAADLTQALQDDADAIRARLGGQAEEARGEALGLIERLSKSLHNWKSTAALLDWSASPLKGENLRPFIAGAPTVDISNLQRAASSHVSSDQVLAAIGKQVETAAQFSNNELRMAAKDGGLVCSSIVRRDQGPTRIGGRRSGMVVDLVDSELSVLTFTKGSVAVTLLVARETIDKRGTTEYVRQVAGAVAAKFESPGSIDLTRIDQAACAIIDSFTVDHGGKPDPSSVEEIQRRTELLRDGSEVEVVAPEEHHQREQAERRAHENATAGV